MKRTALGLTIVIFALAFAQTALAKKKPALKPVGIRLYHFEIQGRTAPVAVWYPAVRAGAVPFDYNRQVKGTAFQDAEPDKSAAYPLIVFSHGIGACGYQSVFYIENLVRAGFVVAAMDHKDAAMCVMEGAPAISQGTVIKDVLKGGMELNKTVFLLFKDRLGDLDFSYRPRDIRGLIDRTLDLNRTDPVLKGMIDPQRIGATGHSLGGYTTLAIAGGEYNCIAPSTHPEKTCSDMNAKVANKANLKPSEFNIIELGSSACCLPSFQGKDSNFRDDRVSAALALAPAVFYPKGAFHSVKIPMMIITGTGKFEVPFEPISEAYNELSGPKYLLQLKGVDHMTIADIAYQIIPARLVLPGFRSRYQMKKAIYENFPAAFFKAYLYGDQDALDYLTKPHYPLVGLQEQP